MVVRYILHQTNRDGIQQVATASCFNLQHIQKFPPSAGIFVYALMMFYRQSPKETGINP